MKKIFLSFLAIIAIFLSSCDYASKNPLDSSKVPSIGNSSDVPSSESRPSEEDYINENITFDDLFNIEYKVNISLDIDTSELIKLNKDYLEYSAQGLKSPIYRLAKSVTITITKNSENYVSKLYNVGFRMKGNTSRKQFMDANGNIIDNIHLKLSFEETFDDKYYTKKENFLTSEQKKLYKDRKFLDLSKIDLRFNNCEDGSYIKEYYALSMFRSFGIMTQRINFSSLSINKDGKNEIAYGIYLLEEPLTKTFIKRTLSSGEEFIGMSSYDIEKKGSHGVQDSKYGQLYKASYGIGEVTGAPDMTSSREELFGPENEDTTVPPYELKTNTDIPDNSLIRNAFNVLNGGDYQQICEVVDMDYFLMYEALATIIGDPDDLRNNYNNYGLYFRKTDGKMVIIPIDKDRAFGITRYWDPSNCAMSEVSAFSSTDSSLRKQKNNLYLKTILSNETAKSKYKDNLRTILASDWLKNETFEAIHNKVKLKYEEFAKKSMCNVSFNLNEKYDSDKINMSFKDFISKKISAISKEINESTSSNPIAGITEFYLTGNMDNWNKTTPENKFMKMSETVYSFEYNLTSSLVVFKIYIPTGAKWLRAESGNVLQEGANMEIKVPDYLNKKLLLTIDVSTGVLTYTIS